jgi:hypothetical protein
VARIDHFHPFTAVSRVASIFRVVERDINNRLRSIRSRTPS